MSEHDQLERIHAALMRNAEGFRRRGDHHWAAKSEDIAARLRHAINRDTPPPHVAPCLCGCGAP